LIRTTNDICDDDFSCGWNHDTFTNSSGLRYLCRRAAVQPPPSPGARRRSHPESIIFCEVWMPNHAPGPPPECSAGPYDPVLVTRERTRFVIHSRPVRVRPGDESPSGPSLPIEPTRPTSPYHCFRPVVGPLVTSACRFNFASRRGFGRTLPSAHRSPCAMAAVLVAATMDLGPLPTCPSYLSRARECSSYGRLHVLL